METAGKRTAIFGIRYKSCFDFGKGVDLITNNIKTS